MGTRKASQMVSALFFFTILCQVHHCLGSDLNAVKMRINASSAVRRIPDTMFGLFFEEINHAGAGGIWTELVSNRGFEAGEIVPWTVIGDTSSVTISTDLTSSFERNKVALKMDVLCDGCPGGGVGIYNPGFWGMNIEKGKKYNLVLYAHSSILTNITAALTDATGAVVLASATFTPSTDKWTKQAVQLVAQGTSDAARLQLTANNKVTIWLDQVSLMPVDTFKGHGFRNDLATMLADLKPAFLRIPGGCFVEGVVLKNSFHWKDSVGPWEERPGHYNDVWKYWTDDGIGLFEYFQLAEDLGAAPIWVFNSGIAHEESVDPQNVGSYVQDALDGLEFANGDVKTKWGSLRSSMGHPSPFNVRYVAIGNEDCYLPFYLENYMIFYNAIKKAYPDMKIISNCNGSLGAMPHPADYYDYHIYADAGYIFNMAHGFDQYPRLGPKAFVSEYAVTGPDAGTGTLLAALAEAAFLIGLENNCDLVEMACYAPIFTNVNDRLWNPDAIPFNSSHSYGTPSYYMQQFFIGSNGATLLSSTLEPGTAKFIANAILWTDSKTQFLRIKAVNFDGVLAKLSVHVDGVDLKSFGSSITQTELTHGNVMDENSLDQPLLIVPVKAQVQVTSGQDFDLSISPNSVTSFDFVLGPVPKISA